MSVLVALVFGKSYRLAFVLEARRRGLDGVLQEIVAVGCKTRRNRLPGANRSADIPRLITHHLAIEEKRMFHYVFDQCIVVRKERP